MNPIIISVIGIAAIAGLFTLNWWRARSWLDPSVAISAVWIAALIVIVINGGRLYGISWLALSIFLCGLTTFSIGSAIGAAIPARAREPFSGLASDGVIIGGFLLILVLGMPFYLRYVLQLTTFPLFSAEYFVQIRDVLVFQSIEFSRAPLVANLVTLSSIFAVLAFALSESGRRWWILVAAVVGLGFVYNFLTGAKAGALSLLVTLFVIYALQKRRLPKVGLLVAVGVFVASFGVVTVQRALGTGVDIGSFSNAVRATLEKLGDYLASGPVGFSAYLAHPHSVAAVWSPWRFFERTTNYFGNYFDVPDMNAQYTQIGPGLYYNTYSAFFSYYPIGGVLGVAAFMLGIGVAAGAVHRRAVQGRLLWQVLYAPIYYGVLMTVFNESLLLALNPIVKLLILSGAVAIVRQVRLPDDGRYALPPNAG